MTKFENILTILKKESFRFHERLETNMRKFSLADQLIILFLTYQLLTYSLYRILGKFDNQAISDTIKLIFDTGLVILQANSYSPYFHTAFSFVSVFMSLLFIFQTVVVRLKIRSRYLSDATDLMFMLGSVAAYVSPLYFLVAPYHLIYLFSGMCPPELSQTNFGLLFFSMAFLVSCLFLHKNQTLVSFWHLAIPIFNYLKTNNLVMNAVLAALAALSFWQSKRGSERIFSLMLLLINCFAVIEEVAGQFSVMSEVMGCLLISWFILGYFCATRNKKTEEQQVRELEILIKNIQKPETQKKEFYIECLFIEHFLNCAAPVNSFCAEYTCRIEKKPILTIPKQNLMVMLEQKIATDFQKTDRQELEICLSEFRFNNKSRYLRLYKEAEGKMRELELQSFIKAYQHYKMCRKFQKRLEKQTANNLSIFEHQQNFEQQKKLFCMILQQLHRLRNLWVTCKLGDQALLQTKLCQIIKVGENIQNRFTALALIHRMSNHKMSLYEIYCRASARQKFSNSHSTIDLSIQEQLPNSIIFLDNQIQKVSRGFEIMYFYSEEELLNNNFNVLLPKGLHCMHEQRIDTWNGGELRDHTCKILVNGRGYVDYFEFTLLVYPDFENGLKYIGYFDPKEEKQLCLYNIKDDHFWGVSQEFQWTIKGAGYSQQIIKQLRCQDVFNGVDLKSTAMRERLKSSYQCFFTKERKMTDYINLRLLKQYLSQSGHFALLCISKNQESDLKSDAAIQTLYQRKIASKIDSSRTSEKVKLHERVSEIKEEIRQPSKFIKKIFIINVLFVLLCAIFLTYMFVVANNRLVDFITVQKQTELKLQIRLLFSEIVWRNTEIYTLSLPSHLPAPYVYAFTLNSRQIIQDRINSIDTTVLSRLSYPAHNQILTFIQLITDDQQQTASITTILQNVELISELMELPESTLINDGISDSIVGITAVSMLGAILLVVNLILAARIEAPIPMLRQVLLSTKEERIERKIQELDVIIGQFDITEEEKNELEVELELQKNEKKVKLSSVSCRIVKVNLLIYVICFICSMIIGILCLLEYLNKEQGVMTDKIQILFFRRSVQLVKLIFLTHLHFIDMANGVPQPSPSYKMFLQQLDAVNTRHEGQYNILNLDGLYAGLTQDICPNVYPDDPTKLAECRMVVNNTMGYGLFKSIYRLQFILTKLNQLPDMVYRYDDGTFIEGSILGYALSQYNRAAYEKFTALVQQNIEGAISRNLAGYLVLLFIISSYFIGVWIDRFKKNSRVNLLKEMFVLTPNEQFETQRKVRVLTSEEDILNIIKNL